MKRTIYRYYTGPRPRFAAPVLPLGIATGILALVLVSVFIRYPVGFASFVIMILVLSVHLCFMFLVGFILTRLVPRTWRSGIFRGWVLLWAAFHAIRGYFMLPETDPPFIHSLGLVGLAGYLFLACWLTQK